MKRIFLLAFAMMICLTLPASAHKGRTDANGGHYDHSTGEYHYHHGYPAHQHANGTCPYNFDDRTEWNSGGTSSGSSKSSTPAKSNSSGDGSSEHLQLPLKVKLILAGSGTIAVSLLLLTSHLRKVREEKERIRIFEEEKAKYTSIYGGKDVEELVDAPKNVEIGADGLPKEKGCTGWGPMFTYYSSFSGSCFHCVSGCSGAVIPTHAVSVMRRGLRPCMRCHPECVRNLEWYWKYLKIKEIKDRYGIK